MNVFIWAPQAITGRLAKFSKALGPLTANTPPYSWLGFSVEQLMIFGTIVDIAGIFGLFNFPKLAGSIVFAMTAWRQIFLRLNLSGNMPNHPLCAYASPHCLVVDLVHFTLLVAAVFVFTSPLPMPETTLLFFKQLGISTRWLDRRLHKLREYMPVAMRPEPLAQVVSGQQQHREEIGAGGKSKNL